MIQFSHGDVLMVGAFAGFSTWLGLTALGITEPVRPDRRRGAGRSGLMALLGALIARFLVLPLKGAPALNTLLITLCSAPRFEASACSIPTAPIPTVPGAAADRPDQLGDFTLRLDSVILLLAGLAVIVLIQLVINRTRLGLAIRAVAQDAETAATMGIDIHAIVLITFAIGSAAAAFAGVMNGLYLRDRLRHRPSCSA